MWRVYYSDRPTYSSEDGPPETVPGYGVQAIVQPDRTPGVGNVSYLVLVKYDWFMWHLEDKEWFGVMGDGSMLDQLLSRQPVIGICQGRRIPTTRFQAICEEAAAWAAEQGLRPKDGKRTEESV